MFGIFDQYRNEGIDQILLRRVKQSSGGRKTLSGGNDPAWKNAPRGTGVQSYTAPDTMRKKRKKP